MGLLQVTALRSTCPRAKVAACMLRNNAILLACYNGAPHGFPHCEDVGCQMEDGHCVRATHAEMNLIGLAAREGIATLGATICVTHFPCLNCTKSIIRAGFSEVWYMNSYRDNPGLSVLQDCGIKVQHLSFLP